MKFAISVAIAALAGLATATVLPRQSCPEAAQFGILTVSSPTGATSYNPGDPIDIHADFSCAINTYGIVPQYIDYTIVVPEDSNNGHEPNIVLARRTLASGATSDSFSTTIPYAFYFSGAAYNVFLLNTYPINGTNGSPVLIQGGMYAPITINVASS